MGKTATLTLMDQVVMLPHIHQLTSTDLLFTRPAPTDS